MHFNIDIDNDWCEFFMDDVLIVEYQWSLGAFGTGVLQSFGGVDFFGGGISGTVMYYFDNVVLRVYSSNSGNLTGYNVYLDNMSTPVASNITDLSYTYNGLPTSQNYIAGVSAVYDEGESAIVEESFTFILSAEFMADITYGYAPLMVNFTDQSTGPTSWTWDFDNDGTVDSNEQNPTWTYNSAGIYSVSLTVADGVTSETVLEENYINVIEPNPDIMISNNELYFGCVEYGETVDRELIISNIGVEDLNINQIGFNNGSTYSASLQNAIIEPGDYLAVTISFCNNSRVQVTDLLTIYSNDPDEAAVEITLTAWDGAINVPGDFATIQEGINATVNDDIVLVQPGTYFENINFNGKNITVASLFLTTQNTTYISQTIIDGSQPTNPDSASVVTFTSGEDTTAVLTGFTIQNGSGTNIPDYGWNWRYGGGIYCVDSSPSLMNVKISNNYTWVWPTQSCYGGGIHCENSNLILRNVTITGNTSRGQGGGINCENSNPTLQNVTISDNSIVFNGGGMACTASNPILENVIISNNSGGSWGGGIYCNYGSNLSLLNVTITGNTASDRGGGISLNDANLSLVNVTIANNYSENWGGGIICYSTSNLNLENVTIIGNSADTWGGGIFCWGANPEVINSILWNNSPEEIYFPDYSPQGSISISYSDIQNGEAGIITNNYGTVNWLEGNIESDPLFVDSGNGDYHLQSISPCIDAGDPASLLDPDGTIADMGAYYFDQTIAPDPPQNVTVEIIGTDVHLSWDAVTGANSYKVYSSDDPYTGFIEDTSGSFAGESWSVPVTDTKSFYKVSAVYSGRSKNISKKSIIQSQTE